MAKETEKLEEQPKSNKYGGEHQWSVPSERAKGYAEERRVKGHKWGQKEGKELTDYEAGIRSGYLQAQSDHAGLYKYNIIETASRTLVIGCKNSVIPDDGSVTAIGSYAFYYCKGLTSIVIPDSVTSIGNHAFGECSALVSVTFQSIYNCYLMMPGYNDAIGIGGEFLTNPANAARLLGYYAAYDWSRGG